MQQKLIFLAKFFSLNVLVALFLIYSVNSRPECKRIKKAQDLELKRHNKKWKRAATENIYRTWPEGIIPYEIDPDLNNELHNLIRKAMNEWESKTCLRFIPVTPKIGYELVFKSGDECKCCSLVGKNFDRQYVILNEDCNDITIILHELGHAIGFYDEQNRPDRDQHVKILFQNIKEDYQNIYKKQYNFLIDSLGFPYDFESIMHLRPSDFVTSAGKNTMQALDSSISLENGRKYLSKIDIAQTNKLYRCPNCLSNWYSVTGTISNELSSLSEEEEEYCQWYIRRNQGEFIELVMDYIDITESDDCSSDYVEIQDGYWTKSPILSRFCGNNTSDKIYKSTSNTLLITYKKKYNSTRQDVFGLTYRTTCSGKIVTDTGRIESPQFPESYPLHPECDWIITVSSGHKVFLKFQHFNIPNCQTEYVEIRDGEDYDNKLLGKFCGSQLPEDIISSGNTILVRYVTEKWREQSRFSASFIKEMNECELPDRGGCSDLCVNTIGSYHCECLKGRYFFPDNKQCEVYSATCGGFLHLNESMVIASPLFPNKYPKNIECLWTIANTNVLLTFLYFEIEGSITGRQLCYDKVVISGSNIPTEEYCGFLLPEPLNITDTNNLKIELISDDSIETHGFAIRIDPLF